MPENTPAVPAAEEAITSEWLRLAVGEFFPESDFMPLEKERIGEEYGFASRILRCQWTSGGEAQSVVAKLWDTAGKAGQTEVHFYRKFREPGARVPYCFYAAVDEQTIKAVLVLEDLQDAVQGDCLLLLDRERAEAVAHSLARLHAAWLAHPELAETPWLPDVSALRKDRAWFENRRTLFLERFNDRIDGLARLLLEKIELAGEAANQRLAKAAPTLLHGDFHLDNLLFVDWIEPVFLDWSRPVKGPAALNLIQLLTQMTPLDNFNPVFDAYIDEFNRDSDKPVDKVGLERELGGALLRSFTAATCGVALWQPSTPRGVRTLEAGIALAVKSVEFWYARDPALFSFLR